MAAVERAFDGVPPEQQRLSHFHSPALPLPMDPSARLQELNVVEGARLLLTVVAPQRFHLQWADVPARSWTQKELRQLLVDIGANNELLYKFDDKVRGVVDAENAATQLFSAQIAPVEASPSSINNTLGGYQEVPNAIPIIVVDPVSHNETEKLTETISNPTI
eukprot:SAG31_NODE_4622_length_3090_cov_1.329990_4_plen_163_part_00